MGLNAQQLTNLRDILMTVCPYNKHLWNTIEALAHEYIDIDMMLLLHSIAPPIYETIIGCGQEGTWFRGCSSAFRMVYTDQGLCYTFNGISFEELYRDNV